MAKNGKPLAVAWDGARCVIEIPTVLRIPVVVDVETATQRAARKLQGIRLTNREQQVLDGLLKQLADKEIASKLNVGIRTVKFYVSRLLEKFNVRSRWQLVILFVSKEREESDKSGKA